MSHSPLSTQASPSIELLNTWLDDRKATRHPSLTIVDTGNEAGWTVKTTNDIERGTVLCTILKSTIFSHRTATLPTLLPELEANEDIHPILLLSACLLHELRLGEESKWYGWLQILPRQTVILPTFWDDEGIAGKDGKKALKWLKGTEGERELKRKDGEGLSLDDLNNFHSALAPHLPPTSAQSSSPAFADFVYAFSMVSTRGFIIDDYHSIGMIPFCDMFNHSSCSPHTSLACDSGVCPICGSLLSCSHDTITAAGNVSRLETFSPEYLDRMKEEGNSDTVDMRVERRVICGEEVFSCYEEGIGDEKLLVEWGFVPDRPAATEGGQYSTMEECGPGLIWSPRDILTPQTIRAYIALIQRDNLHFEHDQPHNGILGSNHIQNQPGLLNLTRNGQLSINVLAAIYVNRISKDGEDVNDVEEVERGVLTVAREIHHRDTGNIARGSPSLLEGVVEEVLKLIQSRLDTMYRPDRTDEDVDNRQMVEAKALDAVLVRMAWRLASREREVLEKANQRWLLLLAG